MNKGILEQMKAGGDYTYLPTENNLPSAEELASLFEYESQFCENCKPTLITSKKSVEKIKKLAPGINVIGFEPFSYNEFSAKSLRKQIQKAAWKKH